LKKLIKVDNAINVVDR